MRRFFCILLVVLLLTGCHSGHPAETTASTAAEQPQTTASEPSQATEPVTTPGSAAESTGEETVSFANPGCVRVEYTGERRFVRYVTRPEELPEEAALSGYDAAFFADRALVLVYETVGSGSIRLQLEQITAEAGTASVHISRSMPGEVGTADMATWLLWAEVEKGLEYSWEISGASQESNVEKY